MGHDSGLWCYIPHDSCLRNPVASSKLRPLLKHLREIFTTSSGISEVVDVFVHSTTSFAVRWCGGGVAEWRRHIGGVVPRAGSGYADRCSRAEVPERLCLAKTALNLSRTLSDIDLRVMVQGLHTL